MNKIKEWIKAHRGLSIIGLLSLVLFIIMLIIMLNLLLGGSSNKYGNRLDGINNVKITDEVYSDVKQELEDTGLTEKTSTRLQGKIIYTTIVLKSDTSVEKAKEIASNTIDNYSEEQLKFYDICFFLKWNGEGENKDVVITGTKHHNLDKITWINS